MAAARCESTQTRTLNAPGEARTRCHGGRTLVEGRRKAAVLSCRAMGKGLNPADAQRKAERKREVRKNKTARTAVRTEKLFTNPGALRDELERWKTVRAVGVDDAGVKVDGAVAANRVKKLEEAYNALLKKKKVRAPQRVHACVCGRAPPVLALTEWARPPTRALAGG